MKNYSFTGKRCSVERRPFVGTSGTTGNGEFGNFVITSEISIRFD